MTEITTHQFMTSAWSWNPWIIAVCIAMTVAYVAQYGFRCKLGWMLSGMVIFFLTLCSPLNALADGYLFSAHMLQHLLLLLIVPALILLSLPRLRFENLPVTFHPMFTWLLGVGGMWVWHIPALCNAAVTHNSVHILQCVSLLLMGIAFWWPIIEPANRKWMSPLFGIIYLFSACLACTLLGILITFSPVEICSIYHHPVDRLGILPLLRDQWGVTTMKDQQIGGLLMWVPSCVIYFTGIIGLLYRWYRPDSSDE